MAYGSNGRTESTQATLNMGESGEAGSRRALARHGQAGQLFRVFVAMDCGVSGAAARGSTSIRAVTIARNIQ